MSDDVFDGQMFAEKLSKLNSSQQSIESLSTVCITQRKKAKQIVGIWHKSFKSAQKEQHVAFLYLANDIMQNSRRKGSEFVHEFWKVIPSALKHVNEHGDENGKKATARLVGIWDERKVFGSRVQNLKDEMLGGKSPPTHTTNVKTSNPNPNPNPNPSIKIVKRDANSLRLKLAVGGSPEKIMSALHLVHEESGAEETALNNCEGAVRRFGDLERDIETQGVTVGSSSLVEEIQEQEKILQECVTQLESAQRNRTSLISQLKLALQDQELKLDVIQSQLQVARHQIDEAANLRKKLGPPSLPHNHPQPQPQQPPPELTTTTLDNLPQSMSFTTTHVTEDDKKAAAAAVAAKLSASTSSLQMLSSALSSLAAEEAAAAGLFSPEKRQKLDNPMPVSDSTTSDTSGYFSNQTPFPPPPPLPPSSMVGTSSPANQFVQSSGLMMAGMPYGYGASSLPPPPPVPSHIAMGLMRPGGSNHQQQNQNPPQPPQTNGGGGGGGYYRPPGIGFYGQNHQPTPPPPVPRQ